MIGISNISGQSQFTASIADFLHEQRKKNAEHLDSKLRLYGSFLSEIKEFNYTVVPGKSHINGDGDATCFSDVLEAFEAGCGIDRLKKRKEHIHANGQLLMEIEKYRKDQFVKLRQLLSDSEKLIDTSVLSLVKELEFYVEINDLTARAEERGIATCFPEISDKVVCSLENVTDITLLDFIEHPELFRRISSLFDMPTIYK